MAYFLSGQNEKIKSIINPSSKLGLLTYQQYYNTADVREKNERNELIKSPSTLIDYLIPYSYIIKQKEKDQNGNELWGQKTYGKYWPFIKQNKIIIDMNEEICAASIGKAGDIYKKIVGESMIEIWDYSQGFTGVGRCGISKLYFKDEVLYKIIRTK